jgi:hypothetical protein
MGDNKVLKEILVMVKALTEKINEQQEKMLKLNERSMEHFLVIKSLTTKLRHVKTCLKDIANFCGIQGLKSDVHVGGKIGQNGKLYANISCLILVGFRIFWYHSKGICNGYPTM